MILLMSKCIINEAEPAELLSKKKYYNFNSTRKYRYIEFRHTNASMSFCETHRNILPVPQIYLWRRSFRMQNVWDLFRFYKQPGESLRCTFQYDMSNGMDFTNAKQLPQVFRSLKNNLKVHVKESNLHKEASAWIENREQKLERQRRFSARAGLTVGRHGYSILYRGGPYSDFTMDILLAAKGGAVTGDLNHSKRFVDSSSIFAKKVEAVPFYAIAMYRKASSSSV